MSKDEYLKGIDVVYYINLDRSPERKEKIETMLKDPCFEHMEKVRIKAVDGKNDDIDTLMVAENKNEENVIYACTLSHLNSMNEFIKSNHEIALILEDDSTLEYKPKWKKPITDIMNNAPKDWDIIMLTYTIYSGIPKDDYAPNFKGEEKYSGTGAYIVNKSGAKKIIDASYKDGKYFFPANISSAADRYLYMISNTYVYKFPYFIYSFDGESTIHQGHVESIHRKNKEDLDKLYENSVESFTNMHRATNYDETIFNLFILFIGIFIIVVPFLYDSNKRLIIMLLLFSIIYFIFILFSVYKNKENVLYTKITF